MFNSDNFYNAYYKQEMSLLQETVDEKKNSLKKQKPELKTLEWWISRLLLKLLVLLKTMLIRICHPRKKFKIQPISVSC